MHYSSILQGFAMTPIADCNNNETHDIMVGFVTDICIRRQANKPDTMDIRRRRTTFVATDQSRDTVAECCAVYLNESSSHNQSYMGELWFVLCYNGMVGAPPHCELQIPIKLIDVCAKLQTLTP